MDFIRAEKCKSGYNPNMRHCLYGLDADLVSIDGGGGCFSCGRCLGYVFW